MEINQARYKKFKKLWKQYLIDEFSFPKDEAKKAEHKNWKTWEAGASVISESECARQFCDWLLKTGRLESDKR